MPATCVYSYSCSLNPFNFVDNWNAIFPEFSFSALVITFMFIVGLRLMVRSEELYIIIPAYFLFIAIVGLSSVLLSQGVYELMAGNIGSIVVVALSIASVVIFFRKLREVTS